MFLRAGLFTSVMLLGAAGGASKGVDVTQGQRLFKSGVVATSSNTCTSSGFACAAVGSTPASPCSTLSGTVTNKALWGGTVTVYVICPAGSPTGSGNPATTTTELGSVQTACADGSFTIEMTNECSGQTGCYGLIAAAPPSTACGAPAAPAAADPATSDPGWNSCTGGPCPSP